MSEAYLSVALTILIATAAALCVREFVRMLEVYDAAQRLEETFRRMASAGGNMAQAFGQMTRAMSLFVEGMRAAGLGGALARGISDNEDARDEAFRKRSLDWASRAQERRP